ncbi:MAG: type II secretion system protein GspG, partial [Janthinobacterium lividum]
TGPATPAWAAGGYLPQLPIDPWGRAYRYLGPGEHAAFDLSSYGRDGQAGGEGVDADLVEQGR